MLIDDDGALIRYPVDAIAPANDEFEQALLLFACHWHFDVATVAHDAELVDAMCQPCCTLSLDECDEVACECDGLCVVVHYLLAFVMI